MVQWYYSRSDEEQQGPVSEDQLLLWLDDGTLPPKTLVWNEGMKDWKEARKVFGRHRASTAPSSTNEQNGGPGNVADLPSGLLGWMKVIGILSILCGIPALCMAGLGLLPILAGIHLLAAAKLLTDVPVIDPAWQKVLRKLRGYFMMLGIFAICYVLLVLGIILFRMTL